MFIPPLHHPIDDIDNPRLEPFLKDLQGNILKGHGRDNAAVLLLNFGVFGSQPAAAKAWIRSLVAPARPRLTSAFEQERQSKERKKDATKGGETFQTLAISNQGYAFLGIRWPGKGAFKDGMQQRGDILSDPPVAEWEPRYRQDPRNVHALLQIANKDPGPIAAEVAKVKSELAAFGGTILAEEVGTQLRANGEPIEHFGYRDGVSQPAFIKDRDAPQKPKYDQHSPLSLVLVPDPPSNDPARAERFGSYLVFRKLEQNPRAFEAGIEAVVNTQGMTVDRVLAGAMAIGRFKDGTPVVLHETGQGAEGDTIDFDFSEDDDGQRCPFAGHVRKVNPRREASFFVNIFAQQQSRRIARRGITYGERPDLTRGGSLPQSGVGLLFMCYQADIDDQFEFIQRRWANGKDFLKDKVGLDPVIGQTRNNPRTEAECPRWPVKRGSGTKKNVKLGGYVSLKGGEYFFAPSMATLRSM